LKLQISILHVTVGNVNFMCTFIRR